MAAVPTHAPKLLPAAWDLAVCLAVFLQGVLCTQLIRYTSCCNGDSVLIKLFVAGLALATWLKAIQSVFMLWLQNITMYTNEDAPSIWVTNWCSVMASAAIGFYVQMFFCYRLWAIGRSLYLVLTTVTLFVVALSAAGMATYLKWTLNYKPSSLDWYAGYLGAGMCGDLCLTGGIVFSLLHHRQVVLPRGQTAKMLDALLRLSIQSAAPAAMAAALNLAACIQLNISGNWFGPQIIVGQTSNTMLPLMYAIAAMWKLNSRAEIRAVVDDSLMITLNVAPSTTLNSAPQSCGLDTAWRLSGSKALTSHTDEEKSTGSVPNEAVQREKSGLHKSRGHLAP
ncbi:hypothetical protein DFH06DRAFT_1485079 [Mycena polygramma]|nr:hypothetical protein DFH06DRAFT_1485079 [Mycena polygramma]